MKIYFLRLSFEMGSSNNLNPFEKERKRTQNQKISSTYTIKERAKCEVLNLYR